MEIQQWKKESSCSHVLGGQVRQWTKEKYIIGYIEIGSIGENKAWKVIRECWGYWEMWIGILHRVIQNDLNDKELQKVREGARQISGEKRDPGRENTGAKALRWGHSWHVWQKPKGIGYWRGWAGKGVVTDECREMAEIHSPGLYRLLWFFFCLLCEVRYEVIRGLEHANDMISQMFNRVPLTAVLRIDWRSQWHR